MPGSGPAASALRPARAGGAAPSSPRLPGTPEGTRRRAQCRSGDSGSGGLGGPGVGAWNPLISRRRPSWELHAAAPAAPHQPHAALPPTPIREERPRPERRGPHTPAFPPSSPVAPVRSPQPGECAPRAPTTWTRPRRNVPGPLGMLGAPGLSCPSRRPAALGGSPAFPPRLPPAPYGRRDTACLRATKQPPSCAGLTPDVGRVPQGRCRTAGSQKTVWKLRF